jgi:hypothetical protein
MAGIRISAHARQRAKERQIHEASISKVARRASREGDGNYAIPGGWVVVRDSTITTVLSKGMELDKRLHIYQ